MTARILLIGGSLNQTKIVHKISLHLQDFDCYFTPYYADGLEGFAARAGWLDFTVLGGRHYRDTMDYLTEHDLPLDLYGKQGGYDLVITASDLIVPKNVRNTRLVLVQEGITESEGTLYRLVKTLKLPRYLANTAATGLSNSYDVFCVASEGYRELFIRKGVRPEKIVVTGIPNFDHVRSFCENDFPHRNFVLVVTSDHATPVAERTHVADPVPFLVYQSEHATCGPEVFTEASTRSGAQIASGPELLQLVLARGRG